MIAIAIDGPAGAGKSTIAKKVSAELGFVYVDTGALYRAIGLFMLDKGIDTKDSVKVISLLSEIKVELIFCDGTQRVLLMNDDVSEKIRTPEVSMAASDVSAIPEVRAFLFDLQQNIAESNNVIMDGRDIGTVVLPNAQIKIFLTASPEDRAMRRYKELSEKNMNVNYEDVLEDIKIRDFNDSNRPIAPLKPAPDSILIDTTGNSLEQSINILASTIKERLLAL